MYDHYGITEHYTFDEMDNPIPHVCEWGFIRTTYWEPGCVELLSVDGMCEKECDAELWNDIIDEGVRYDRLYPTGDYY